MRGFLRGLLAVETLAAGAFYTIAAAILFADVISREIFSQSIWGGQRIAVLLANAAALIGIAVAVALHRHIRPSVLDNVVPDRLVPLVTRIGNLVSAAVMFCGAYFGALLVLDNREMGFTTPPLDLEIWIPQLALPYGLASAGLRFLIFAVQPELQPDEQEAL
jgi:TRAP-type C4-dicarboxylate transport system permease small subunit